MITVAEMESRVDDLATNTARALTPYHYQKTIQAFADCLEAKRLYDEKPGFWRGQKLDWQTANLKPGLERLAYAYQLTYGEADLEETQLFYDVLKLRAQRYNLIKS